MPVRSVAVFEGEQMVELNLSGSQITILPFDLGRLHLRTLRITDTKVAFLPPTIGLMRGLQELVVRNNLLPGLPPSIGELQMCRHLDISGNKIDSLGLPGSITFLTHLEFLDVSGNKIHNPPPPVTEWLNRFDSDWALEQSLE